MDGVVVNELTALGTIFSVIGAAISIWQAMKARGYKDEILHDRLKILLIELMGIAKRARDECKKIITPVGKPPRGVDQQIVINCIRDCLDKLKDNSHKFSLQTLQQIIVKIEKRIDLYASESDAKKKYSHADQIYKYLGDTISFLNQTIDSEI